ncbi:MAG: DinB family protein [Betaproteobacteria bacterium]|nr:DinB family protein [Betaproteobacteria bacterium]
MLDVTLAALAAFPDQLERHFAAFAPGREDWKPESWEGIPSESLSAREQICHVRDIEIDGYQVRFRRLLNESRPTLASLDTYALVKERNYAGADAKAMLAQFRAARRETLQQLGGLSDEQLSRPGHFDDYGEVTLLSMIHYLCSHDQQHLAGLQWLLGQVASIRS